MCPLPNAERRLLLDIARRSLIHSVENPASELMFSDDAHPLVSAGAFVTLQHRGRLRGCIGQIGAPQPVTPLVAYCARAAALEDPRFRPVEAHELREIEIELSILSALEIIAPDRIEIGRHGVMVTHGATRGVLLPQVAVQYRWNAIRFLEESCVKAGLDRSAWRDKNTLIEAFTAEIFSESDVFAGVPAEPRQPHTE